MVEPPSLIAAGFDDRYLIERELADRLGHTLA
jgi:hypothetical protein